MMKKEKGINYQDNPGKHQQNVKTTCCPSRGIIVPIVLLVHSDLPLATFSVNFE